MIPPGGLRAAPAAPVIPNEYPRALEGTTYRFEGLVVGIVADRRAELNASRSAAETIMGSIGDRAFSYPVVVLPARARVTGRTED